MINVRPANKADFPQIMHILKEQDLFYSTLSMDNFIIAENEHEIAGIVKLEDYPDYLFISSVGVATKYQHQGIASILLNSVLDKTNKDCYLYTIIPDFFAKIGFKITPSFPDNLPSKARYECITCVSENCVVMVKQHAA